MAGKAASNGPDEASPSHESLVSTSMFLRLCILVLLAEGRGHGYEILQRLELFGIAGTQRGSVYHILRKLEDRGFIRSAWDLPEGAGPARRVYELAPAGKERLIDSAPDVEACYRLFEKLLERYATVLRDD